MLISALVRKFFINYNKGVAYLIWHYTSGFKAGLIVARDLARFVFNFFSLAVLIKTWLKPWRRLGETYAKGLAPEKWFETLVVNILMRLVGVLIRTVMIVIGLLVWLAVLAGALFALLAWLLWPVIFISLVVGGLFLLTK